MTRETQLGLLYITLATLGYSFLPIFGRAIYPVSSDILTPTDVAFWRFALATPIIWLMIQSRPTLRKVAHEDRRQVLHLLGLGFLYALSAIGAFAGLLYINANTFTALFYTYPAMVALIGVFLGVRLPLASWGAIALVLVGVFLTIPNLSIGGDNMWFGVGIALLTALSVAVYYQFIQRVMEHTRSTIRGTAWIITGTLFSLLLPLPFFGLHLPPNLASWGILLGLATISSAFPIFLVNLAVRRLGATRSAIVGASQPAVTIVLAAILLGETSTPIQWLGAGLIITAVIMLELRPKAKPASD